MRAMGKDNRLSIEYNSTDLAQNYLFYPIHNRRNSAVRLASLCVIKDF